MDIKKNQHSINFSPEELKALNHAAVIGLKTQAVGFGPEDLESELFAFSQEEYHALQTAQDKIFSCSVTQDAH
ncbi:hypothetical protein CLV24_11986 [Pontibacter ummariensis]|uniref:Uncharacterized protein n=1 Tax=Pontibacter ummariensis TaxID=1610492 RepID=A0A239IZK1_9BACT|nr:hypothetical protein [Pontibacter ummariensis]PRY09035.1 hypothetical protein CLV24_11986 [Pontibacter ummariensis]SNS98822.1 hypothetical protein SAMN06296052_11986 [Pontibacter ummariensis]